MILNQSYIYLISPYLRKQIIGSKVGNDKLKAMEMGKHVQLYTFGV